MVSPGMLARAMTRYYATPAGATYIRGISTGVAWNPREGEEFIQQLPPTLEPGDGDVPKPAQRFPHAAFDVVALASSAGGIAAIGYILENLPAGFPAASVVGQHPGPRHPSLMAAILPPRTPLQDVHA